MQFETKTSIYDLTKDKYGAFLLKKIVVKAGHNSDVRGGETFYSKTAFIDTDDNCLCLEGMHTSPVITNLKELQDFINSK